MGNRIKAILRIFAGFYGTFAEAVGFTLGGLLGVAYGIPTILWQLITGKEMSGSGKVASAIQRLLQWPINLYRFSLTGEGKIQWLP